MPNTIILRGDPGLHRREKIAAAAIKPGHVVEVDVNDKYILQATADIAAEKIVAVEDSYQGSTIDTAYSIGDRVSSNILRSGDEFYGWLKAGANALESSYLCLNGDGGFDVVGASEVKMAKPVEAVDNSGGGAQARIKVRWL